VISVDPYHTECWDHLMAFYDQWLKDRTFHTSVVRLDDSGLPLRAGLGFRDAAEKFRDWTGYQDTVKRAGLGGTSPGEYGYRLRAEDFVDQG